MYHLDGALLNEHLTMEQLEKKVLDEGIYTIDENSKVTFTPEPDFVGKATGVTVKRVGKNGNASNSYCYTPKAHPDYFSPVDKEGNLTLHQQKHGTQTYQRYPRIQDC
ncbi:MAG: hypothetical protein ACLU4Q_09080 [Streptococcus thermophilus]